MSGGGGVSSLVAASTARACPPRVRYRPRTKVDQWICFGSIIVFYNLFGLIVFYFTRIMPPRAPGLTTPQIVEYFASHREHIRIGMALMAFIIGFASMANGLVVLHMKRMSGIGPTLAYAYLAALAVGALPGALFIGYSLAVAAMRPDRPPALIALLFDMGFLSFIGSLGCFATQYLVFAIAILLDRRAVFPKWLAYVSIWGIVTEILAAGTFIFKKGPFAWDGSISFWLGTAIFVVWLSCLIHFLVKAIKAQPEDEVVPA